MKKIITISALTLCYISAKAQSKILISYDANGNRVKRYYVAPMPAPPRDSSLASSDAEGNDVMDQDTVKNGLQAFNAIGFKVYPNPSNDQFNIALDEAMLNGGCEIVLTDQLGKIHYRKRAAQVVTTLSTKHLVDGVYYVIVNYADKRSAVKVIKESAIN